jgi:hypothetical protein
MILALRALGLAGAIVFGLAFAVTFLSPIHVERAARGFIQGRMEAQLARASQGAAETRSGRAAKALAERHSEEIGALKERMAVGANAHVAAVIGRMQDPNCDCRKRMLQALDAATESRISTLERAEPQLRRILEGRYGRIVTDLLRDLRIFTGTNLFAFLMLLGLSIAKPGHVRQLFVPGILLGTSAIIASGFYLFGQNWFFTLLYGDFVGWAYAIWLLLVFGLLCDIALFKARITTRIVNVLQSAFGTAAAIC